MRRRASFVLAIAFLLLVVPHGRTQNTPGQFDFYVLALSWSPSYCETAGGRGDEQCNGRPFAFVVHGLWPQHEHGYPQDCVAPAPRVDDGLIRSMLDVMPGRGLVIHEWRRHGTCSGLAAADYFALARRAWQRVTVPPIFRRIESYVIVTPDEGRAPSLPSTTGSSAT
jgi:ribonuclease T2